VFAAGLLYALPLCAQQPVAPPSPEPAVVAPASNSDADVVTEGSAIEAASPIEPVPPANDRLFWVMPNYLSIEGRRQIPPLSTKMKFKFSEKTMTDPVTLSFIGTLAALGQATNSNPSYGQELSGYVRRYATVYADTGIGTLMTSSIFPTLLKQDPRYFQSGEGRKAHRMVYAVSRIFITRSDAGASQFNFSEIVGTGVAAALSNTYHPRSQRTLGNTLNVWATNLALNALCDVAKEFWPDVRRKFQHPAP
jgi:hypothetical protein